MVKMTIQLLSRNRILSDTFLSIASVVKCGIAMCCESSDLADYVACE